MSTLYPATDYISGERFEIVHCRKCGLHLTQPQPAPSAVAANYPATYYGDSRKNRFPGIVERLQTAIYQRRASYIHDAHRSRPGRVLDVGCGRGWLLNTFRRLGWEVQGTELTAAAAAHAREVLGLPVALGHLEALRLPGGHYDAITLWHVLEHVPDPQALLAEVHRLLAPGGVLFVGSPNFGGWEARVCRDKWFHLDVPRHLTHLTRESLQQTLEEAGMVVRDWSGLAPEYDCFSFVQSLENRLGLRHNLLYSLLRRQGAKVLGDKRVSYWQVVACLALALPLGLLSVPATLALGLKGQGGTIVVLARKREENAPL